MTKMPDKLADALKKAKHTGHRINVLMHPDDKWILDELVKAAEIPQPVTDEARAKALEWFNDCEFFENHFIRDKDRKQFIDTIKAALSQPSIPVQDKLEALKVKLTEVKKCLKTTQKSLERVSLHRDKVVEENADLRRAVVDLADCLRMNGSICVENALAYRINKHAAIIKKAKESHV